ncbi:hypothetical protein [Haliscomenobacter sp.]|uniref:hypothetical protein n=1 Tax=Haliscomenobacter sp. TaxID=2717303 RepID=UPI0035946E5D
MERNYAFEELQKTVIILSLPAAEQIHAMGGGYVGDEMAIDYHTYFTDNRVQLLEDGLLTEAQVVALEELGRAFPSNKVMDVDFWLDQGRLFSDPQWDLIREKAMIACSEMGLANARLQVNIEQGEVDDRGLQWMRIQTSIENG